MRLRILDLHTPWFWLVMFAQRAYSQPLFQLSVYEPSSWKRWWFHFWKREIAPWEQEPACDEVFNRIWDNPDDAEYDKL